MTETPEECTKKIYEPCRLHPVDCPNCENEPTCRIKDVMRAHPNQIKRCKQFDPKH